MNTLQDILTIEDIKKLVDTFYGKVRQDELLAPIFNEKIGDQWPKHLEKMYTFWQTVLLGEQTYYGSPFPKHAQLPVDKMHFQKWIELFNQTVDELFQGEKATEAKLRAGKMAEMFNSKIEYSRKHGLQNLM
jgi:hemoglobin